MTEYPISQDQLSLSQRFTALFALSGFAIAQPLFDLFGRSPEFFVIRRTTGTEIFCLIALLLLCIPIGSLVLQMLLGSLSKKLLRTVHYLTVASLVTLIALPIYSKIFFSWELHGYVITSLASVTGLCAALLYAYKANVRALFRYLAIGAVFFATFFVYTLVSQGLLHEGPLGVAVKTENTKPAPVFMIIFDEFPLFSLLNEKKEINESRFPAFADLSRHATWFRNGTTVSSWTERAVPTILSGLYPNEEKKQLPSLQHYPQNIFTLLSGSHVIKGFEQVTHLCPDSICKNAAGRDTFADRFQTLIEDAGVVYLHLILPESMKKSLPDITFQWGGFLDTAPPTAPTGKKSKKGLLDKGEWGDDRWLFSQFIESIRSDVPQMKSEGKVPFYMVHITFPHVPYRFLPDGSRYLLDLERTNDVGYKKIWAKTDVWPAMVALQRFILQAGYADTMIRDLLAAVRDAGVFDESMIVVTADHGSSFQPGEFSRRVSDKNYMDVMMVPFFIKVPGQTTGTINERNVESIDIVPSMLRAQGLETSQPLDGYSVFDTQVPEREFKTFFPLEQKKRRKNLPKNMSVEPSLSRSIEVFGAGGFDDRFFSAVPHHRELLGTSLGSLSPAKNLEVHFDAKPNYAQLDKSEGYLPVYLWGYVSSTQGSEELKDGALYHVIIGVDGKVQGITQTEVASKGRAKFSVIIPPSSLNGTSHAVEALVIK